MIRQMAEEVYLNAKQREIRNQGDQFLWRIVADIVRSFRADYTLSEGHITSRN